MRLSALILFLPAVVACGGKTAECPAGTELHDDGLCYEADTDVNTDGGDDTDTSGDTDTDTSDTQDTGGPPDVDDVLSTLPDCEPGYSDGALDIFTPCVNGLCEGDTYSEFVDAFGEGDCRPYRGSGYVDCDFGGIGSDFPDVGDGTPDPEGASYGLFVYDPYDGGTADGLSVGASMSCWTAVLGAPDVAGMQWSNDQWYLTSAEWPDLGLYVYDYMDSKGGYDSDGYTDYIYMYGSDNL